MDIGILRPLAASSVGAGRGGGGSGARTRGGGRGGEARRRGGGRLGGTGGLDLAPLGHVPVMLFQRLGKGMTAGAVGHEIEILGLGGICHRRQGFLPGLPMGPGGRPSIV